MDTLFPMPDTNKYLYVDNGVLVLKTPYNAGLVMELKATIPGSDRAWDAGRKVWKIDPKHGDTLKKLIYKYMGEKVHVPTAQPVQNVIQTKLLEVHYLGQTKDNGSQERIANGYLANQTWGVIFPESILRSWFEAGGEFPDQAATLYSVLVVSKTATPEEIKTGYRRMVMQWHPDRCKDVDAAAQFMKVQNAFEILSNQNKRARYDAGLALEATLGRTESRTTNTGFRSPLRCGYVLCNGVEKISKFWVEIILSWQDIYNPAGQMLVSSWVMGADKPREEWV